MAEIADEECLVGAGDALAEASRGTADTDRLDLLGNHPAAVVLTVDPLSWRALAVVYDTVGRLDAAAALLAAVDNGGYVLIGQLLRTTERWPEGLEAVFLSLFARSRPLLA
ncbi:hypothetical protein [Micromonospora aurantiaca (nom. illeg.)]|uniref:hypothetical protein n=1 Tax=Micromonospora aurantiaca (nom. illeg.) TaxID=47850 RepID=UPI003661E2CC